MCVLLTVCKNSKITNTTTTALPNTQYTKGAFRLPF